MACLLINDPNFEKKLSSIKLKKLDELLRNGEGSTITSKRKMLIYNNIPTKLDRCGVLLGAITKKKYKNTRFGALRSLLPFRFP